MTLYSHQSDSKEENINTIAKHVWSEHANKCVLCLFIRRTQQHARSNFLTSNTWLSLWSVRTVTKMSIRNDCCWILWDAGKNTLEERRLKCWNFWCFFFYGIWHKIPKREKCSNMHSGRWFNDNRLKLVKKAPMLIVFRFLLIFFFFFLAIILGMHK